MNIAGRTIGSAHPVYVIAELGVNHDGSLDRALALVDAAADAGADAIKLQLFRAPLLMSRASRLAAYQSEAGESDPLAMLQRLELPLTDMATVIERAHARSLAAILTVFSTQLVAESIALGCDAYKSASPDIIHRPLLEAMAATDAPLIISTGAATPDEVRSARQWLGACAAAHRLAFLQCVSSYPTTDADASLGGIPALAALLPDLPIGYSDHTQRIDTGFWAACQGASILEKHLTHDRAAAGPDHAASLDPDQFRDYCDLARRDPANPPEPPDADLIGPIAKRILPVEHDVRTLSRQSIVTTRDIPAGTALTPDALTVKRPGTGIPPFRIADILTRTTARSIAADMPITEEDLA